MKHCDLYKRFSTLTTKEKVHSVNDTVCVVTQVNFLSLMLCVVCPAGWKPGEMTVSDSYI